MHATKGVTQCKTQCLLKKKSIFFPQILGKYLAFQYLEMPCIGSYIL
jgi:hypothetical protein